MSIGKNIQYLRKINQLTQEQFSERSGVSRQTISRWESDEVTPELNKLIEICTMFSCSLDDLVRQDLRSREAIYSEVEIRKVPAFRMARYVMISPNPEQDVLNYMMEWGKVSGLLAADPDAKLIGWDFPFVSQEQQMRFGLHGYVAAYILPEGFQTSLPNVEYAENKEAQYAVITVTDPMVQPFERITTGYQRIMKFIQENDLKEKLNSDVIECFEHEYDKDGVHYMDIYVHVD